MRNTLQTKDLEAPLPSDAHKHLVERIAASRHFRKSPRLREFLSFIAQRSLAAQFDELTEQNIGCRVFGRPSGYRPAEDNIVRVSVRQLRSKLRDYFDSEGRDEAFILEIPHGGYIPVFRPAGHAGIRSDRISGRWLGWLAATACVFMLMAMAAAIWFWRENQKVKTATTVSSAPTLVSELLLKSNQPVTVVMSDYGLVLMQSLLGRRVALEQYARHSYLAGPPNYNLEPLANLWQTLATRQITSADSITLVSRLLKAHPDRRDQILIRHARSMDIRDFKAGNFIIQGGVLSIPWIDLFEPGLNFRPEQTESGLTIRNVRPQPGESAAYGPAVSGVNGETSYARIILVPNLSGTGKVLLLAGFNMAASESAAEFVLAPSSVPLLRHTLGQTDLSKIEHLELLLQTSALDGSGRGARIVAFRR